MRLETLSQILARASKEGWSTAHFNISTLDQMRAIINAAANLRSPVVIGTSEGERKFLGLRQAVALREAFREELGLPIFLNADHSKSVASAKAAIDAGYDSIHIDLSALAYEENVAGTKEVVEYAKKNQKSKIKNQKFEINVEGELGILKGESKIQKEVIGVKPEELTTAEQAADFVARTGIDRLAPAVGSIHGIAANKKVIYPDLIKKIREAVPEAVGITLHGGSGISDEQVRAAIEGGVNNVHINTEIRVAWTEAARATLSGQPDETTPYKILQPSAEAVRLKVEEKLKLFGSVNKV